LSRNVEAVKYDVDTHGTFYAVHCSEKGREEHVEPYKSITLLVIIFVVSLMTINKFSNCLAVVIFS